MENETPKPDMLKKVGTERDTVYDSLICSFETSMKAFRQNCLGNGIILSSIGTFL